jgi:hypothetical protein
VTKKTLQKQDENSKLWFPESKQNQPYIWGARSSLMFSQRTLKTQKDKEVYRSPVQTWRMPIELSCKLAKSIPKLSPKHRKCYQIAFLNRHALISIKIILVSVFFILMSRVLDTHKTFFSHPLGSKSHSHSFFSVNWKLNKIFKQPKCGFHTLECGFHTLACEFFDHTHECRF